MAKIKTVDVVFSAQINRFVGKHGWASFLALPLYPALLMLWMPYRLARTLWNARILAAGKWSDYLGFSVLHSINQLYYWNDALNIDRYGRDGFSPYKGIQGAELTYLHKYSLPSLYAYWAGGAVVPIFSMAIWVLSHLPWFYASDVNMYHASLILALMLVSTTYYGSTFIFQNYNVIGWACFPIAIWAMISGHPYVAALAWLAASMGSVTVVAIGILLSLVFAIKIGDPIYAASIIPAAIKCASHLYWPFSKGRLFEEMAARLRAIGAYQKSSKYKREKSSSEWTKFIYIMTIYSQFAFVIYIFEGKINILLLTGLIIFMVNTFISRFMDDQSVYIMMMGLITAAAVNVDNFWVASSYWIAVSPLPLMIGDSLKDKNVYFREPLAPFNLSQSLYLTEKFFQKVPPKSRVLIAYNDPKGKYNNVFDGYGVLMELPQYISTKNKIQLFPDWWSVFQNNYEGAPEFWGRKCSRVKENVAKWSADFILIYQDSDKGLDPLWEKTGFELVSELDWGKNLCALRNEKIWGDAMAPKWVLLDARGLK